MPVRLAPSRSREADDSVLVKTERACDVSRVVATRDAVAKDSGRYSRTDFVLSAISACHAVVLRRRAAKISQRKARALS